MAEPIRLGTRASLLARTQSGTVGDALAALAGRPWSEILIRTHGDDTTKPLNQPGTPGLFVSSLRHALLSGEVDVIVHSFKDLPSAPAPGIVIAAVPVREDRRDALVSRDDLSLVELPFGAVVGTSSPRRAASLLRWRPDLVIRPIRGNVDTRIAKVRDGEFDATILAMAGLRRIGREGEVAQVLSLDEMLPAPAQGALAVECRSDDAAMRELVARLDHPAARLTTSAEREVLVGINAACTTAIAAAATYADGVLTVRAELSDEGGIAFADAVVSATMEPGDERSARVLGLRAAGALLGAGERPPVLLVRSEGNENDAASLAALGFPAVSDPYVQIAPLPHGDDAGRLLDLVSDGAPPDSWLVVTSPMTVPSWASCVGEETLRAAVDVAIAKGVRAAATGERTAASLRGLGFADVLVPEVASAQGLVDELAGLGPAHAVFPRGNLALRTLPEGLRSRGWDVEEGVVYETSTVDRIPASVDLVRDGDVSAIVLRSPSAVRALVAFVMPLPQTPVVCAGSTTAAAAREAGLTVAAIAASPSSADVAIAVADLLGRIES